MTSLKKSLSTKGRYLLSGVPEGYDARVLIDALNALDATPVHIHVARDAERLAAMQDALAFFAPDLNVIGFSGMGLPAL